MNIHRQAAADKQLWMNSCRQAATDKQPQSYWRCMIEKEMKNIHISILRHSPKNFI